MCQILIYRGLVVRHIFNTINSGFCVAEVDLIISTEIVIRFLIAGIH